MRPSTSRIPGFCSITAATALILATSLATGCGTASNPDTTATGTASDTAAVHPEPATPAAPRATAPRAAAPRPAARQAKPLRLEAGTPVIVRLRESLTSETAMANQPVSGEVAQDVIVNGRTVIPAGSRVDGTVSLVQPAKRFGGQASVTVRFDLLHLPSGVPLPVEGEMTAMARKETGRDTAKIAGGAGGGALLGKVLGKDDKDAAVGAVLGGAIGTAVAAKKGQEAFLDEGEEATVTLRTDSTLTAG